MLVHSFGHHLIGWKTFFHIERSCPTLCAVKPTEQQKPLPEQFKALIHQTVFHHFELDRNAFTLGSETACPAPVNSLTICVADEVAPKDTKFE